VSIDPKKGPNHEPGDEKIKQPPGTPAKEPNAPVEEPEDAPTTGPSAPVREPEPAGPERL
jgi:hypothetical protein